MSPRRPLAFLLALFLALFAQLASAQYPNRAVKLPFPPSGATDVVGRLIAAKLGERLGQAVVVDNRPGAGRHVRSDAARWAEVIRAASVKAQ